MRDLTLLLAAGLAGYLIGSIPTGVLLAKLFGWPDPRFHGSGHTGGLNVGRGAGKTALVMVAVADALKGLAAALAGSLISDSAWAVTLAGTAAVAGHCWPVWLRFRGGMGLATGFGAVLAASWPTALIALGVLAIVRFFVIKHSPRASIVTMATIPITLLLLQAAPPVFWLGTGCAAIIALRHTVDWNRKYD